MYDTEYVIFHTFGGIIVIKSFAITIVNSSLSLLFISAS